MKRIRVIPSLLIQKGGLVKSVKFKDHKYVGDPINAVKIFNDKEVDELVLLDISATAEKRGPQLKFIIEIASEAFMPMAYGGGINSIEQIRSLITGGIEKVVLNTAAFDDPTLITQAAEFAGSQSVVVSMDVKKNLWGKYQVYVNNGTRSTKMDPVSYAKKMESLGAGEIILMAIDRDGSFQGYDLELIKLVSEAVSIPVVAIGGSATVEDFGNAIKAGASAVSAGSQFVFQRPHRAVLISYPSQKELKEKLFTIIN
jgi:cyclase